MAVAYPGAGTPFGADSYYQWLKEGILAGDVAVMEQMIVDVNRYARPIICSKLRAQEAEDVLQEVDLELWKSISGFLVRSDDYHPFQRQHWLKQLIINKIYDYFRDRINEAEEDSIEEMGENGRPLPGFVDLRLGLAEESGRALSHILTATCAMRIEPDKMLTFFYHNIIFFLEGSTGHNGKPKETAQRLNGKTLGQLRKQLVLDLEEATGVKVEEEALAGLDEKLRGREEEIYQLTPGEISVSTSNTRKRVTQSMRPQKEE